MNNRVHKILTLAALITLGLPTGRLAHVRADNGPGTVGEWTSYSGDKAGSKYSPLAQVGADNFNRLRVAWTWRSADEEIVKANPRSEDLDLGIHPAHGRRRLVCQHVALPGRCH